MYVDQAAVGVGFWFFPFLFVSTSFQIFGEIFQDRTILGALDRNLEKILNTGFTKMQESYKEMQENLHGVLSTKAVLSFFT